MKGNTENSTVVAVSYEKQKLIDWYNSLLAPEPYKDNGKVSFPRKRNIDGYSNASHSFHKVFIKGSELEWYNPCDSFKGPDRNGQGLSFQWVEEGDITPSIKFIY